MDSSSRFPHNATRDPALRVIERSRSESINKKARFARPALLSLAASLVAVFCSFAFAQFEHSPFDTNALDISAGLGAEVSVIRLEAATAMLSNGADSDDVEEVLEGLRFDTMRFGAALAAKDADAADAVDDALEQLEETDDDDFSEVVAAVMPTFEAARDAVVPADPASDPAYTAAVMTLLLTSETGVSEGYEGAVEGEPGPYAIGWAALARTQELWTALKPLADDNQVFEIDDMFQVLAELFPTSDIPAAAASADPEEAEGPAMRITGYLESIASASLFPNRDLVALIVHTRDLTNAGCDAYAAGDRRTADAHLSWTAFAFQEYLADPLGLFAPEPTADAAEALEKLVPLSDDDDDEVEDDNEDAESAEWTTLSDADAGIVCASLVDALQRSGAALGL